MISNSFIICTYNRAKFLRETIASVLGVIGLRQDCEIVVINNNSPDETEEVLKEFQSNHIRAFLEINQGLSYARNRGIKEAKGDILIFIDDDIDLECNYIEQIELNFKDPEISILGGKVLPFKTKIPSWLPSKYYYLVSVFDMGDIRKIVDTLMGANYAMRRQVADKVGLYNVDLGRKGDNLMGGEENDYLSRAKFFGYTVTYDPKLIVFHKINDKLTKRYVLDHSYLNGSSNALLFKKHNKIKFLLKTPKALLMICLYYLFGFLITEEKTHTYLEINKVYSKGYLKAV